MKTREIELNKLDKILANYKGQEGVLISMLHEVQTEFGWVPPQAIDAIADALKIFPSQVYSVATFCSFLSIKPQGRNAIRICQSLPCLLKHAQTIIKTVQKEVGIMPGETTPDGRVSFELTNCIGACDKAPAMMVNSDVHGDLTPKKIARILQAYK